MTDQGLHLLTPDTDKRPWEQGCLTDTQRAGADGIYRDLWIVLCMISFYQRVVENSVLIWHFESPKFKLEYSCFQSLIHVALSLQH